MVAIAAAAIGAAGSIGGAMISSGASGQAAKQSLTGYNYLTGPQGVSGYVGNGSAADNAISQLLLGDGGSGGGGVGSYGATGQQLMDTIAAHAQNGAAGLGAKIQPLINSGASPAQIQAVLNDWGAHTTSPGNAAAKAAILDAGQGLTLTPASAGAGAGDAGSGANSAFKNYLNSSGYKFMLGQGEQAVTGSAAARGILDSGATAKALTKYGTDLASTYFNNYLNQLGTQANRGLTASGQIGAAGTTGGGNAGAATAQGGQDLGNGIATGAGAIGNYFGNAGGSGFIQPVTITNPYGI